MTEQQYQICFNSLGGLSDFNRDVSFILASNSKFLNWIACIIETICATITLWKCFEAMLNK